MESRAVSVTSIVNDLRNLGIKVGDVLFITADLEKVGLYLNNRSATKAAWLQILKAAVGESGTIVVAGYTQTFPIWRKDKRVVFDRHTASTSGALSTILSSAPEVQRSAHPTNSCFALGPKASDIVNLHNEHSKSYTLLEKVIENGGKNLMLGTLDKRNAPMAFHLAQQSLGLTTQDPASGIYQTYYRNSQGQLKLFTKKDVGGCSRGAYNLYGALVVNNAIKFGRVGNAESALIEGGTSLTIVRETLLSNPAISLCGNPGCLSCYGSWRKRGLAVLPFYAKKCIAIALGKLRSGMYTVR